MASKCDDCMYFTYDEEYGYSVCEQDLDEDEFLDVEKIPLSEAVQQVMDGEIKDAKTQIIILKAARLLGI